MTTVSDYMEEGLAGLALADGQPDQILSTPSRAAIRPLRLALCTFAAGPGAGPAERMQATLAVRYIQQQLVRLGAEVALPPPLPAGATPSTGACGAGDDVDALVVFPAFCGSPAALAAVLSAADRPGLIMALSTGFEDDGELAAHYGNALACLSADVQAALASDDTALGRQWIEGTLFDVRAWFEAGQWLSALRTSVTLARCAMRVIPRSAAG